jgi:hypothetical protein
MFRFACAREVVILALKHHDLRGHTEMLETTKPLLTLLEWHAKVVV